MFSNVRDVVGGGVGIPRDERGKGMSEQETQGGSVTLWRRLILSGVCLDRALSLTQLPLRPTDTLTTALSIRFSHQQLIWHLNYSTLLIMLHVTLLYF